MRAAIFLGVMCLFGCLGCTQRKETKMDWFTGKELALQQAVDADDVAKLREAVQQGGNVNAHGRVGVTLLEYAIGHFKKQTYKELLALHADPNLRDDEKDNAMTLATRAYEKDPDYLELALKAGGDPNTRAPNNSPIINAFIASPQMKGIRLLAANGANLNITDRVGYPILLSAALSEDWDAVWTLLQLGASYDFSHQDYSWQRLFTASEPITKPDSPLFKAREDSRQFLIQHGVALAPGTRER